MLVKSFSGHFLVFFLYLLHFLFLFGVLHIFFEHILTHVFTSLCGTPLRWIPNLSKLVLTLI